MLGIQVKPVIDEKALFQAASYLAERLRPFQPTMVVYVESGGTKLGCAVADLLKVPSHGLDICYPASRVKSGLLRRALFPLKEVFYRFTVPSAAPGSRLYLDLKARIALVDDSASTGKTLRVALQYLSAAGIVRDQIRTGVLRCGPGARDVVDFFHTSRRVRFTHRSHRS